MNAVRAIPNFFKHYANASRNRLRQQLLEGKADPYFKFFTVVGFVGYMMTWNVVTSEYCYFILFILVAFVIALCFGECMVADILVSAEHRVAEKQDVCAEAMKHIHHH